MSKLKNYEEILREKVHSSKEYWGTGTTSLLRSSWISQLLKGTETLPLSGLWEPEGKVEICCDFEVWFQTGLLEQVLVRVGKPSSLELVDTARWGFWDERFCKSCGYVLWCFLLKSWWIFQEAFDLTVTFLTGVSWISSYIDERVDGKVFYCRQHGVCFLQMLLECWEGYMYYVIQSTGKLHFR